MIVETLQISLADEHATHRVAQKVTPCLQPGDVLLLEGPIGAGKTAFARAVVQTALGRMEDVPSPTFTLVQTYETSQGDIWHCDLYRLSHPDDVMELGLDQAFTDAICLIEWPDRLGQDTPKSALRLSFRAREADHLVEISLNAPWKERLQGINDLP
ncbi:MAG: tRNA (adenosine(37)-N6)-threonylcarbamoyltransferase complex ATPase subunit type 1 TsaE [Pseudomonadota bacterium]